MSWPIFVAPAKKSTFVTVPSLSVAVAWMVTLPGALKIALFVGLVMVAVGATLPVTVTFTTPGVYAYGCLIHTNMKGTITVT